LATGFINTSVGLTTLKIRWLNVQQRARSIKSDPENHLRNGALAPGEIIKKIIKYKIRKADDGKPISSSHIQFEALRISRQKQSKDYGIRTQSWDYHSDFDSISVSVSQSAFANSVSDCVESSIA